MPRSVDIAHADYLFMLYMAALGECMFILRSRGIGPNPRIEGKMARNLLILDRNRNGIGSTPELIHKTALVSTTALLIAI